MFGETNGLHKNTQTAIISSKSVRNGAAKLKLSDSSTSITDDKIMLFILGIVERINFTKTPIVILGRFDWHLKTEDQLDLVNYGAVDRGVSRNHCKLEFKDRQLIATDLGSANGTYVSGQRLEPNQPRILKKGEELTLGRLPIQFMTDR